MGKIWQAGGVVKIQVSASAMILSNSGRDVFGRTRLLNVIMKGSARVLVRENSQENGRGKNIIAEV